MLLAFTGGFRIQEYAASKNPHFALYKSPGIKKGLPKQPLINIYFSFLFFYETADISILAIG